MLTNDYVLSGPSGGFLKCLSSLLSVFHSCWIVLFCVTVGSFRSFCWETDRLRLPPPTRGLGRLLVPPCRGTCTELTVLADQESSPSRRVRAGRAGPELEHAVGPSSVLVMSPGPEGRSLVVL